MNVLVLGAGVIGTTAAWYLRAAGHEVTVVVPGHRTSLKDPLPGEPHGDGWDGMGRPSPREN
jgi:glycine/D-amino acid oxidase-like deaminating enzyme